MSTPRIVRITVTYGSTKPRRKPKAGDEKMVKGVTYIRQQVKHGGAYLVSGNRPVWEWVVKGSEDDRSARQGKAGEA